MIEFYIFTFVIRQNLALNSATLDNCALIFNNFKDQRTFSLRQQQKQQVF